ncbi:MAG: 2-iminoacetate synthase ThiH [Candidatus Omnitrophota bacterium]|jgi:2-iminoacetate synthase|nr:MAG: 2-iminoacetate synthase ThiH [Candidatus Omnitrophota bacterium]
MIKNSFYDIYEKYKAFDFEGFFVNVRDDRITKIINKDSLREEDFLCLLSDAATGFLEQIAVKARNITIKNFGRVICLYAPLYLSNYCENECLYCGFSNRNKIKRKRLSKDELGTEAKAIRDTGIRHILVLTGESRKMSALPYISECIETLREYFTSISIEIYPLESAEYKELINTGADGLAIYQETYDRTRYQELHSGGPKSDYLYRLDAPERACMAGIRSVSIGALLGLSEFRKDIFFTGLHASYLQRKFPSVEFSVSLPRLQPQIGGFKPFVQVSDKDLVQAMLALRLFIPRLGINISTRENSQFRSNIIGLGVTRMSAGSKTEVGGYSQKQKTEGQFEILDKSSVSEVKNMIRERGYQPVMKDWQVL